MNILSNLLTNVISKKVNKKEKSKGSIIKELIDNPDNFILQAEVEGDEIIVTFTKKYVTKKETTTKKKDLQTKIRETTNKLKGEK